MNDYIDRLNYCQDRRVRAGEEGRWYNSIDENRMVVAVTLFDGYDEIDAEVPISFEVCPTCHGKGQHVNPNVDCNGLTAEDFHEDPDFAEDYISGVYDVACYHCEGKRVVPEVDEDRCDPETLKLLREKEQSDAEYHATCRAERILGC